MATSAELLDTCTTHGLLSKEAAAAVAATRDRLIKQALQKEAISLFGKLRGGFGQKVEKAVEKPLSILEKFKSGGMTGVKEVGEGASRLSPGWDDVGLNLAKMLALAGMTAGATAGVQGIMRHSRDKRVEGDIQSSYQQIFNEYPQLKEIKEDSPGRIERHFGVLAKFAPSLAADPTIAGSWLTTTAKTQYIGPGEVKVLAETQSRIDEMNEQRHGVRGISGLKAGEFASKAMGGK